MAGKIVEKVWGQEEILVNEPDYCLKILRLKAGFKSSKHWHRKKKETFVVKAGSCHLLLWKRDKLSNYVLKVGDSVTIRPGQPHEFWAWQPWPTGMALPLKYACEIYEVSTHHSDDDVVRETESGPL